MVPSWLSISVELLRLLPSHSYNTCDVHMWKNLVFVFFVFLFVIRRLREYFGSFWLIERIMLGWNSSDVSYRKAGWTGTIPPSMTSLRLRSKFIAGCCSLFCSVTGSKYVPSGASEAMAAGAGSRASWPFKSAGTWMVTETDTYSY